MSNPSFEPERAAFAARLNWLRAGVLGANDGIVSVAALVVGVAAATTNIGAILVAGIAGLTAGAISMALGEFVSVSSQRDSEKALIEEEKIKLRDQPETELEELAHMYEVKGLSKATARTVAEELTAHNPIKAHLEVEYHLSEEHLTNPLHAAFSSAISFIAGAILPLLAVLLTPPEWRIWATVIAVVVALAITGGVGAYIGGSRMMKPMLRVTIGGALALVVTYLIGTWLGTSVA